MAYSTHNQAQLFDPEFDDPPETIEVWKQSKKVARQTEFSAREQVTEANSDERVAWYCSCMTIWDALRAERLFERYDINTVYDLGAGDCAFSLWLSNNGYDVTAYEYHEKLLSAIESNFPESNATFRAKDYYDDFDDLLGPNTAVVCFGGTNELPHVPDTGLAIEGYGEIGVDVYHDGDRRYFW